MSSDYVEVDFEFRPLDADEMDILCALLAEFDYDSFETTDKGVKAYVNAEQHRRCRVAIQFPLKDKVGREGGESRRLERRVGAERFLANSDRRGVCCACHLSYRLSQMQC